MKTTLILIALGLLAAPAALQGADATTLVPVPATGTADLWVSNFGVTCVDHAAATLRATVDVASGAMISFDAATRDTQIHGENGVVTFNQTGGTGACAPTTMPIVVNRVDCLAGTAHLEAYVQGVKAVSFDATVHCL